MESVTLTLVDYSFHRKVKPYQNLALIITCVLWLIILTLLLFEEKNFAHFITYSIAISFLSLVVFLFLSSIFLFKRKIGQVTISNNQTDIIIGDSKEKIDSKDVMLKLNIDKAEWENKKSNTKELISSLPMWGNFLFLNISDPNKANSLEFEPDERMANVLSQIALTTYEKRPLLLVKTSDLLKNLLWMLWGAS
jgi:hypothetical protein